MPRRAQQSPPDVSQTPAQPAAGALVTVESQREFDLLSGRRSERTFLKLYVEARTSGLLAAISDRDWKTLCTLATYMDGDGYCFPSQAELARAMGCSRQMANERIKSLAGFRFQGKPVLLVEREGRTEQGTWTRNGYHILPIANLGIFDDREQADGAATATKDKRKYNQPRWAKPQPSNDLAGEDSTMSRSLDTDTMSRNVDMAQAGTMSSGTVPVKLDTNKNQPPNQIDNLSNLRMANARREEDTDGDLRATASHASPSRPGNVPEQIGVLLDERALPMQARTGRETARLRKKVLDVDPDRDVILEYMSDWSRELGDRAPLKSSTTRAYNLYRQSGLPLETFIEGLYRARATVKERSSSIRGSAEPATGLTRKTKMAYFFAVLEDLLGLREDPDPPLNL